MAITAIAMAQPGRSGLLPARKGREHDAFCLLKRRSEMLKIKDCNEKELNEPMTPDEVEAYRQMNLSARWLLNLNFSEILDKNGVFFVQPINID
jgi:hypothetical protein